MATKKYVKDYRLENTTGKNGRTVTKPVYAGAYYVYEKTPEEVRHARLMVTIFGAAAVLSLIAGLAVYGRDGFTSQYYTLFPFALCAFPLLYLGFAVYAFYVNKDKITREKKEKMIDRLEKSGLIASIFSAMNLIGLLIAAILKIAGVETRPMLVNDIIFIAVSSLLFIVSVLIFGLRKSLRMVPLIQETAADQAAPGTVVTP